jgi:hypothetical protein
MYKCPKCGYKSENPGTCPTDNETLVMENPETPAAPSMPSENAPSENQQPQQ